MKPGLFIGSSVEGLTVANAIQQNLEHDCNPTVWSQGIFDSSSNTLDSLLKAVKNHHFAIFVFTPDDVLQIREKSVAAARDNIVFELGLFLGAHGKERVFFVRPRGVDLHIPTDLLGIISGTYDDNRSDGNTNAALGPFCTEVREKLKTYIHTSVDEVPDETIEVKKIIQDKPDSWEYLLMAQLMEERISPLDGDFRDLEDGSYFQQTKILDFLESLNFVGGAVKDMIKLVTIVGNFLVKDIPAALGEDGVPAKMSDLKWLAERYLNLSRELLAWEFRLQESETTIEFQEAQEIMKGWSKTYFKQLRDFPGRLKNSIRLRQEGRPREEYKLDFDFKEPPGRARIIEIFNELSNR